MLQLKFAREVDCEEMAAIFGRLGLPVRTSDRSGPRRLDTAGSWTATPPSSQGPSTWSSHGSSSSQTIQGQDGSQPGELPHQESQSRQHMPMPELPHTSAGTITTTSSLAGHGFSDQLTESSRYFHRAASSHGPLHSSQRVNTDNGPLESSHPSGSLAGHSRVGPGYEYPPESRSGELVERSPMTPLDVNQQSYRPPSQYDLEIRRETVPFTATRSSNPVLVTRTSDSFQRDQHPPVSRVSSYVQQVASSRSLEMQQRPWTVHAQGGMAPPPVPDRFWTNQVNAKRKSSEETPSPGRRSIRLAAMRASEGPDDPVAVVAQPSITRASGQGAAEMLPSRELPFTLPRAATAVATMPWDTSALTALAETASTALAERTTTTAATSTPAAVDSPSARNGKSKEVKSPKKSPAKSRRASTSPAKKKVAASKKSKTGSPEKSVAVGDQTSRGGDDKTLDHSRKSPLMGVATVGNGVSSGSLVSDGVAQPNQAWTNEDGSSQALMPNFTRHRETALNGDIRFQCELPKNPHTTSMEYKAAVNAPASITNTLPTYPPISHISVQSLQASSRPLRDSNMFHPSLHHFASQVSFPAHEPQDLQASFSPNNPPPPHSSDPSQDSTQCHGPPLKDESLLSKKEAEHFFDQRLKETVGGYLNQISPHLVEMQTRLRQIIEVTNRFVDS